MAPKKKQKKAPAPDKADKPVDQRGEDYKAECLTGNRAQKGIDGAGRPRYVYEVKWAGVDPTTKQPWKNTFEPANCLIGWEHLNRKQNLRLMSQMATRRMRTSSLSTLLCHRYRTPVNGQDSSGGRPTRSAFQT